MFECDFFVWNPRTCLGEVILNTSYALNACEQLVVLVLTFPTTTGLIMSPRAADTTTIVVIVAANNHSNALVSVELGGEIRVN